MRSLPAALLTLALLAPTVLAAGPATRPAGPPSEAESKAALNASPRHGEYVDVPLGDGKPPLKCWVVYPETSGKAPVVLVIQEIFGLSDWLRATADQLAADGFVAVAPDLLSGRGPNGGGTDSFADRDSVTKAVRDLTPDVTAALLDATAAYARAVPAGNGKLATVGFCWGGGASFAFAAHDPKLSAAVVCYGTPPRDKADYAKIACPVMGFYGGDDARVTGTVPAAEAAMKAAGKAYTPHVYEGAGHGFFRQSDGRNGANRQAVDQGWPALLAFLREFTK